MGLHRQVKHRLAPTATLLARGDAGAADLKGHP